jgi:hypothetical protein
MKTTHLKYSLAALALLSTINSQLSTVFAQGSLNPPGAPAPTMKSLAQIEPRIAITNAGAVTITNPGSYYLTTNITVSSGNAITITANGVTLDLNGFTISSTAATAAGTGILLSGGLLRNVSILNGFIQGGVTNNAGTYNGPGFLYGIYYAANPPVNTRVSRVSVSGCLNYGLYLGTGDSTVVESCTVRTIGGSGIVASTIQSSVAIDCGGTGIYGDRVSDSCGKTTGSSAYGLYAWNAQNCYGYASGNYGLFAYTAQNCYGQSSSSDGINAYTAQNCYGQSSSGSGLYAYTAQSCYGQSSSGTGLWAGYTALNCWGYSSTDFGLSAQTAQNCYGESDGNGYGISTDIAQNCYGESFGTGIGLRASKVATGCLGESASGTGLSTDNASFCVGYRPGGTAIDATVATGCYAAFGTNRIIYKYNMP